MHYHDVFLQRVNMMNVYRARISKDIEIDHISDRKLVYILEDISRAIVYDYLLFGHDVTYDIFIEKLKLYLRLLDKLD